MKQTCKWSSSSVAALLVALLPVLVHAAEPPTEWEKVVAAGKKEGTVVVGIPASSELRTAIDATFKAKFGIELELFPSRGPDNVTRIVNEFKSGVRYFDVLIAGGATPSRSTASW